MNKRKGIIFYKRFMLCSFCGAIGDCMVVTALNWYLIHQLQSAFLLGVFNFLRIVPSLFMGFAGGYLADRNNKKKLLTAIYTGIVLLGFVQALIISLGGNSAWLWLPGVVLLRSLLDGAEPSVRHSLLPEIIAPVYLASAIGQYSAALNLARIVAPVIAGFQLAYLPAGSIFWIDACIQLPAWLILFRLPAVKASAGGRAATTTSAGGFRQATGFISGNPLLASVLFLSFLLMFLVYPYNSLLSVYVYQHLQLDARAFGWLSGITAAGAVAGGLYLGRIPEGIQIKIWPWLAVLLGLCCMALSGTSSIPAIAVILFGMGIASQLFRNINRLLFQRYTPYAIRGKIMSLVLSDRGFIALGLMAATAVSACYGIARTFMLMGLAASGSTLLIYCITYRQHSRPAGISAEKHYAIEEHP